jgi:SAM-dependent methyltransferase
MPITDDEIASVYRLILGREVTPDEARQWRPQASVEVLRRAALESKEFRGVLQQLAVPAPQQPQQQPVRLTHLLPPSHVEWDVPQETMAWLLKHVTQTWTALGNEKPHWSVLSSDQFLPETIEKNRRNFYESGLNDAKLIQAALKRHGREADSHPRMVEYGCGVGRVTPHLAAVFRDVTAIDISTSHLAMAEETTRAAGAYNARFQLARAPHFGMEEPFDLWFSYIVLQHNPPPVIALVLRRALAMLAPGGIAIFQVPTFATGYQFNLSRYMANLTSTGTIEVHCLPQPVVFQLAQEAGCVPLEIREDGAMGRHSSWLSNTFIFAKPR